MIIIVPLSIGPLCISLEQERKKSAYIEKMSKSQRPEEGLSS